MDTKLSWNINVSYVSKKATKVLNLLRHHMYTCRASSKQKAFRALVIPVLDYASKFPSISVNDCTLKSVQRQRYLGVVFDCTLSWTYHVSQVCKKMSYYLYLIGRHKHCLDAGLIKLLLDALVLSHLRYSLPVWGPALSQQSLHRLERMQNWAVWMTMGLSRFDQIHLPVIY